MIGGEMLSDYDYDYGYDVKFVEDVPGDLLCAICRLALRSPVQVIGCGHKFCKCCFEKMRIYAHSSVTDLLCPLDRECIDLSEVLPDKCYERKVLDLQVKCDNVEKKCEWTGDLRSLQVHMNADCLYQVDTCKNLGCDVKMERVNLNERMQTCEKVSLGIVVDSLTQLFKESDLKYTAYMEKFQVVLIKQTDEIIRCSNIINEQNDKLQWLEKRFNNQQKVYDTCFDVLVFAAKAFVDASMRLYLDHNA